jgi:hypothetical protein
MIFVKSSLENCIKDHWQRARISRSRLPSGQFYPERKKCTRGYTFEALEMRSVIIQIMFQLLPFAKYSYSQLSSLLMPA